MEMISDISKIKGKEKEQRNQPKASSDVNSYGEVIIYQVLKVDFITISLSAGLKRLINFFFFFSSGYSGFVKGNLLDEKFLREPGYF